MVSLSESKPGLPARLWRVLAQLALALLLALGGTSAAEAQTTSRYTNTTPSATNGISDTLTPCTNPFKATFNVSTSYAVGDVNIGVLMAHTYRQDLVLTLVAPSGKRVAIMDQTAGSRDNVNVLFDDSGTAAISSYNVNDTITTVPPYRNTFTPSNPLSGFMGEQANGTWTLEICDTVGGDSGTFYQADLYLTSTTLPFANLSLSQTASSTTPNDFDTVSFTVTARNSNASTVTANGITAKNTLPSGLTFVSASASGTTSFNSTTGVWTIGTLAPGASATLTITATVAAGDGTVLANIAEITASSATDLNSTPNNGVTAEDDYSSQAVTVTVSRSAGIAPTLTCSAGSSPFDWDAQTWTAGQTGNTYSLSGIGTVTFGITNTSGVFLTNATYGGQSPAKQTAMTGGLSPAQNSLEQLVNLTSLSATVDTTITLGSAVPGAQFKIFDVDYNNNQFADKVTVTGYLGATPVTPILTNGNANWVTGNTAYGDAVSADTQSNGNVVVTFTSAIDKIVIQYGNHSYAPTDPGQQGISLHDITFCKPGTSISVTKVSMILSDPVNGSSFPKAIPGATVEYCILISNTGTTTLSNVVATDPLPANFTYSTGTMTSGSNCASATSPEDDNSTGTDESDPYGASVSGTNLTASAGTLSASTSFALKFRGVIN